MFLLLLVKALSLVWLVRDRRIGSHVELPSERLEKTHVETRCKWTRLAEGKGHKPGK
jgi:hypothetical protein